MDGGTGETAGGPSGGMGGLDDIDFAGDLDDLFGNERSGE